MVGVKALQRIGQGIGLVKLKRVVRLRFDVHTDNLKACPMIAHSRTTSSAEKVE